MRKIVWLFCSLLFCSSSAIGQPKKLVPSAGVEFSVPAHQSIGSNHANGVGFSLKEEFFVSQKFSVTVSAGYSFFRGDLVYWDGSKDKNFALIPVMIGARCYFHKFFAAFEAGAAIKGSSNVNTLPAVCPSAGVLVNKFEISFRLMGILQVPSIPENTFLQRGGYSYAGVRVSYRIKR
jgi:hypothetical protein